VRSEDTTIVHAGRTPSLYAGAVNPPVHRASTLLFDSVDSFRRADGSDGKTLSYGRFGTLTTHCLANAVAAVEGGYRSALFPSGVAAISSALMSLLSSGSHLLLPNSVYGPTRRLAERTLKRLGIVTTYYDPCIGAGIAALMKPETRVVYVESPGSLTFEVQDVPAIAKVAASHGAKVVLDNTWATPLYFKPFSHGVDVSIQAATKYIVGHSDALLGVVTTTEAAWPSLQAIVSDFGQCVGADDAYLAQRGLRTISVRLRQQGKTGIALAEWLRAQPEVQCVMHPALPGDPGHALWQRDFSGTSGLFGFTLKPEAAAGLPILIESLELFGLGASWGGYESLIMPFDLRDRPLPPRFPAGVGFARVHAGLENVDDLIHDLACGFERLRAEIGR
jgi:cystathionine beta-lyase